MLARSVTWEFAPNLPAEFRAPLARPMLEARRRARLISPADYTGALEGIERGERAATGQQHEELAHAAL